MTDETRGCVISDRAKSCDVEVKRPPMCEMHRNRLLGRIRSIVTNADEIWLSAGRSTAPATQRVGGSRDAALPAASTLSLNGPVARGTLSEHATPVDFIDPPTSFLLYQWARLIATDLDVIQPDVVYLGSLVYFIASHHDWTCSQPFADEYYDEMSSISAKVASAASNGAQVKRGTIPCLNCGQRTLIQYEPSVPSKGNDGKVHYLGGEYNCRNPECRSIEQEGDHEARMIQLDASITTTRETMTG